jgi:curved DNA-binding protein CbpA
MPHRAIEITYYEELGVTPDASSEQIRDSFRLLVRLLHPDQQTDQQLKDSAERQMRKLNRIYAVLSDPDRRRHYDDSLEEERLAPTIIFGPPPEGKVQRLMARFAWVGAVVITVAFLIWLAADSPVAPPPVQVLDRPGNAQPPAPAGASSRDPVAELQALRSDLVVAQAERDAAIRELSRSCGQSLRTQNVDPLIEDRRPLSPPPSISAALTQLPISAAPNPAAVIEKPAPDPPAPQSAPSAQPFTGFWFYSRPADGQHSSNGALYPPEYIEASITEQGSLVRGSYRARYLIVDRAIPPDVNFEFTGTPNGLGLACPWTGPGGAKGRITLNRMQVDWKTSELGSMQGLVVGTATLTRRMD